MVFEVFYRCGISISGLKQSSFLTWVRKVNPQIDSKGDSHKKIQPLPSAVAVRCLSTP